MLVSAMIHVQLSSCTCTVDSFVSPKGKKYTMYSTCDMEVPEQNKNSTFAPENLEPIFRCMEKRKLPGCRKVTTR